MIIHITSQQEWDSALLKGQYTAPSLRTEGFIHCSTFVQTVETANLFFTGVKGLILLCIDENRLASVIKYEKPSGGASHNPDAGLFPHVYGPINLSSVVKIIQFPPDAQGRFSMPELGI